MTLPEWEKLNLNGEARTVVSFSPTIKCWYTHIPGGGFLPNYACYPVDDEKKAKRLALGILLEHLGKCKAMAEELLERVNEVGDE